VRFNSKFCAIQFSFFHQNRVEVKLKFVGFLNFYIKELLSNLSIIRHIWQRVIIRLGAIEKLLFSRYTKSLLVIIINFNMLLALIL